MEGRDAIQWIFTGCKGPLGQPHAFERSQVKVLHRYRLGRQWTETIPKEKDLGMVVDE